MSYFPKFSNFKPHVIGELNKRRGISTPATNNFAGVTVPAGYNSILEISKLNVWVRLTSGVGDGLIIESNPNYNLFRAAGQSNGIYDGAGGTATIGTTWDGRSVSADSGGRLRPKPVVTSVEVDEAAGGISRKATLSITAFSKEQMEKVCEYFLEPGYTVFLEFGWNTSDSLKSLVDINVTNVANMQDFNIVNQKRVNSNGQYENYLGYITGGSVTNDASNWTITVNLTGFTELPFYLQAGPKTQAEIATEKKGSKTYGIIDISWESNPAKKRFKQFYNALAAERRTTIVKNLINDPTVVQLKNFINFDDDIKDEINSKTEGTKLFGIVTLNNEETATEGGSNTEFEAGTKIVGDEKFVRLEVLMKVLTAAAAAGFKIGSKTVNINFDISNTIIGAYPTMFSLDKSKLFIPNSRTPRFSFEQVLAQPNENGERVEVGGDGTFTDNSVSGVVFPSTQNLGNQKPAQYWGYLKDLYVNLDFFNSIVGTKNFSIKDVLYNLLNGLSSAVNSHWDFQIQEGPDVNGVINLEIVDLNFTLKTTQSTYEFTMSGTDSIFIESSFDMDISGQMMNQIISKRLNFDAQKDMVNVGFFTTKVDKILNAIATSRSGSAQPDTPPPPSPTTEPNALASAATAVTDFGKKIFNFIAPDDFDLELSEQGQAAEAARAAVEADEEDRKKRLSDFLGLIGMYPKVEYIDKSQIVISNETPIETYLYRSIYNDSNLLNAQKENLSGSNEYSPILPIKFSFTIHGISGIQRGDKFRVNDIPKTFYEEGFFQITSIKHIVDGMMWKTQVEGSFRNRL